jgi:hypothetical protein
MSNNTSISNLSEVEEVNSGDFFIIDTPDGTQKIDFGNVLIPLDNATFNTTISAHADDIAQNKTELKTLTAALYNGVDQNLKLNSVNVLDQLSAVNSNITNLSANGKAVNVVNNVVQTTTNTEGTQITINSTSPIQTAISGTITPHFKNSKILVDVEVYNYKGNYGGGFFLGRHDVTNNTMTVLVSGAKDTTGSFMWYSTNNAEYDSNRLFIEDSVPAGSTELRYILSAAYYSGTFYLNYNAANGDHPEAMVRIDEIGQ